MKAAKSPDSVDQFAVGAKEGISTQGNFDLDTAQALTIARLLIGLGVPVFRARPARNQDGSWNPKGGTSGYHLPKRWQATEPDAAVLEGYQPGDALAAVMGRVVDVLDVDVQSGGDVTQAELSAAGVWPDVIGQQRTPSGGTHDIINRLHVGSRDGFAKGIDHKGGRDGDPSAAGRGFIWIAPTVKLSKLTGDPVPYRWEMPVDPIDLDPADISGAAIIKMIEAARGHQNTAAAEPSSKPYDAMTPERRARVDSYVSAAVAGITVDLEFSSTMEEGGTDDRGRGWEKIQADAAMRLGSLARADWNAYTMKDAQKDFEDASPTDSGWTAADVSDKFRSQSRRGEPAPMPTFKDTGVIADSADDSGKPDKRSAASHLVDIALGKYTLGISDKEGPFALPKQGAPVVKMLRGGKESLRAELAKEYRRATGKVAPQQALTDALQVLEGEAQELEPVELHMRVAVAEDHVWYDLGDQTGRVVRIGPDGWSVLERAPVLFQRTALTAPSPEPERGGTVEDLYALTNAAPADKPLLIAAMVSMFYPDIAHPIVAFSGEQGTGKSTNATRVTGIVDPTTVPLRKSPRDAESWVTAAAGSWVVTVDNISTVSEWFSDALCRASTGDGDVKRRLYSDAGLRVFSFRRCVMLTGIDLGGLRGDLTERLLRIELDLITADMRRSEAQMAQEYADAHARTLGALLDLLSEVLAVLPDINLVETMRLADFHQIVAAVDKVLGTDGCARYRDQHRSMAADSLTANPFVALMMEHITDFTGTAGQLMELVEGNQLEHYRAPSGWPKSARAVTTLLRRDAPALRSGGWHVDNAENRLGVLVWTLRSPETQVSDVI